MDGPSANLTFHIDQGIPANPVVPAPDANLLTDANESVFMPEAAGNVAVLTYEAAMQPSSIGMVASVDCASGPIWA